MMTRQDLMREKEKNGMIVIVETCAWEQQDGVKSILTSLR